MSMRAIKTSHTAVSIGERFLRAACVALVSVKSSKGTSVIQVSIGIPTLSKFAMLSGTNGAMA